MHSLERMLPRSDFVQIRRSIIANIHRITELHRDADGSGTAVLDGGVRLRVARVRWDALQGALRPERC
jgi:DNA-binding LytR/AlgR family response regulator